MLCDLLWSDPDKDVSGWAENERGVSYVYGNEIVTAFLKKHELDLICRAHQVRSLLKIIILKIYYCRSLKKVMNSSQKDN